MMRANLVLVLLGTSVICRANTTTWSLEKNFLQPKPFTDFMGTIGEAAALAYMVPPGPMSWPTHENKTIANWERVRDLEILSESGVSALVFRDTKSPRAIVAYRGSCIHAAMCYPRGEFVKDLCAVRSLTGSSTFESYAKRGIKQVGGLYCSLRYSNEALNYLGSALEVGKKTRKQFPNHALLFTGHSLGGLLAQLVACKLGLEAVAIGSPVISETHAEMLNCLAASPDKNLWAVYNSKDSVAYQSVRGLAGVRTCLYDMNANGGGGHSLKAYLDIFNTSQLTNCTRGDKNTASHQEL